MDLHVDHRDRKRFEREDGRINLERHLGTWPHFKEGLGRLSHQIPKSPRGAPIALPNYDDVIVVQQGHQFVGRCAVRKCYFDGI
jgi:hypothetical protein